MKYSWRCDVKIDFESIFINGKLLNSNITIKNVSKQRRNSLLLEKDQGLSCIGVRLLFACTLIFKCSRKANIGLVAPNGLYE